MRKSIKFLTGLAIAGSLGIAGGSAYTNSNTMPTTAPTVGYGTLNISGATVTSVSYTLNNPGDTITAINLTMAGDTTGKTIKTAFNDGALATCSGGSFDTDHTDYTCSVTQDTADATKLTVVALAPSA